MGQGDEGTTGRRGYISRSIALETHPIQRNSLRGAMGTPLRKGATHEERFARLLGFPSKGTLNWLLDAVDVAWGQAGGLIEEEELP